MTHKFCGNLSHVLISYQNTLALSKQDSHLISQITNTDTPVALTSSFIHYTPSCILITDGQCELSASPTYITLLLNLETRPNIWVLLILSISKPRFEISQVSVALLPNVKHNFMPMICSLKSEFSGKMQTAEDTTYNHNSQVLLLTDASYNFEINDSADYMLPPPHERFV